jgi:hypothetical protein
MSISLKLLIYILTLLVFIQFGYLYFRSVYNTIDQENNHVLNLELPYIAVFIQIGHYNATNWNNLLDCMNSNVDQLQIRNTYMQTNSKPISELVQPVPSNTINYVLPITLIFILFMSFIGFITLYYLSQKKSKKID